jgi:nicotinamidase/pyrazinamidase
MSAIKKVHLLLIDPQFDFCDPTGALFVPGAKEDMERVGAMIERLGPRLEDIHVTLDQHHLLDVAHPMMWRGPDGKPPAPFTIITAKSIENGTWTPVRPGLTRKMLEYTKALENGGRYPLCIWPPHCLIGTPGAAIVTPVMKGLLAWIEKGIAAVDFVSKGSNIFTEHYSGVKAEVPDPEDPTTQLNVRLIKTLEDADEILIAGEAGSHCLANTVRDIADGFSDAGYVSKFTLLTDGTSPVPGFVPLQEQFVNDMTKRGMKLSTTVDVLK